MYFNTFIHCMMIFYQKMRIFTWRLCATGYNSCSQKVWYYWAGSTRYLRKQILYFCSI